MNISSPSPWTTAVRTLTQDPGGAANTEGAIVTVTTAAVQNTLGAYVTLIAAAAHSVRGFLITLNMATVKSGSLTLAVGGVGAEVVLGTIQLAGGTSNQQLAGAYFPLATALATKGLRIAAAVTNASDGTAQAWLVGATLLEFND